MENVRIEKKESQLLDIITQIFTNNYEKVQVKLDSVDMFRSYLIPTIVSSSSFSTFNIYDEILEKIARNTIQEQLPSQFNSRPLSVSSDLCFESKDCILHIDIKTANLSNPSDYEKCIPVGTNQTTYTGSINKFKRSYNTPTQFKVYPSLPTEYKLTSKTNKITVTLAVQIIYDPYKEELNELLEIWNTAQSQVNQTLLNIVDSFYEPEIKEKIHEYLERNGRLDTVSTNILLKELVDPFEDFYPVENNSEIINSLKSVVSDSDISCEIDFIKCAAIPNGQLAPIYDSAMRSGKKWGDSVRYYHTEDAERFKLLSTDIDRIRYIP